MSDDSAGALHPSPLVLLANEDDNVAAFLTYILGQMGLQVLRETDGRRLADRLRELTPAVLLLESRAPGIDVRTLCARIRLEKRTRSTVILVLLASGDERHQNEILASGADECLARPLVPEKLVASIRAALQESDPLPNSGGPQQLTFRDLEIDLAAYLVRRNGRVIHLAPTEFRLLLHLMKNPHRVHSRNELQIAAWPRVIHVGSRTVDVHIGRLRHALRSVGGSDLIRTVRSVGYALSD
ncbi:MAG: winged helix-turn-helix domain-containing protein [Dongiaceae bacterium]